MKDVKKLIPLLLMCLCFEGCGKNPSTSDEIDSSSIKNGSVSTISEETSEKQYAPTKNILDGDKATIWAAPNTVAIMQDVDVYNQCEYWGEEWLDKADKLHMLGIKGDTESAQLMITAKKDIGSFMLEAADLVNDDGEKIGKENVSIFAERYIEVKFSSSTPKKASGFNGFYPDALVPIQSYKARRENKVRTNENQGIFFTVDIPTDAKPGIYSATFKLTIDDEVFSVPVTLKVYDITMPIEIHERSAFDIWGNEIGNGEILLDEDDLPIDWYPIYYNYLLSKRITPQHIGFDVIGDNYAAAIVSAAQNPRVTGYRIPYRATSVAGIEHSVANYDSLYAQLSALARKNIELRESGDTTTDLFKKGYFYFNSTIDEPTSSIYDAVAYCDKAVADAKKAAAELLNDYPDLKQSCLNLRHVVTSRYNEIISGSVQTWCSQVHDYTKVVLESVRAKKTATDVYECGEKFWSYMTCNSNNPYPSFQLDDNLMSTRILSWMNFDYDIEGTLFWNVCYYSKHYKGDNSSRDIWTDPNTWDNANGDGYLLYPGSKYGLDHPIATLRLENYREGTEDYEYLYMLRDSFNKIVADNELDVDFYEFMDTYFNKIFKKYSMVPTTNVNTFLTVREEVLDLLDLMVNRPNEALSAITK